VKDLIWDMTGWQCLLLCLGLKKFGITSNGGVHILIFGVGIGKDFVW
jgi:hypothetical protein